MVGDPERQIDERRRHEAEHALDGDGLDVGRHRLDQLDDDPTPARAAERHRDDRSLLEPVAEVRERA